jgi:hypothetical protein
MRELEFKVRLDPDKEPGGHAVVCLTLTGCYSRDDTVLAEFPN